MPDIRHAILFDFTPGRIPPFTQPLNQVWAGFWSYDGQT